MTTRCFRVVLVLAWLPLLACRKTGSEPKAEVDKPSAQPDTQVLILTPAAAANARIGVQPAGPAAIQQELSFAGEVRPIPERLATIAARLEGLVIRVTKKEGDQVKRGEGMVTIESKKLAEAKLAYLEAEQAFDFAKEAVEREAELVDKRISSKEAYQKVVHQAEKAKLDHAAALQRLKVLGISEARLHSLRDNPDQTLTTYTLQAPFAGEVIRKDVTMGEAVAEEKPLFELADLSELMVEVKVPIATVSLFAKGNPVDVFCDAVQLKAQGRVEFVASIAEAETRTVPVRVTLPNHEGKWRPGMPARVVTQNTTVQAKVAVPLRAIHEVAGKPSVFVKTAETTYRLAPVVLGSKDDRLQAIEGGLEPGVRVAVENSLTLKSEWLRRAGE